MPITLNDKIYELATSRNAGRAAIKAVNSYFGHELNAEIDIKEFEKLSIKKLAAMPGVGIKSYILLCQAYKEFVQK